jgi:hypothetical protein
VNKTESKIRVKSKKALAARAKRKEIEAAKEFALAEKLPLLEAIAVLRVRMPICIIKYCLSSSLPGSRGCLPESNV